MLQSNQPLQRVAEESTGTKFMTGVVNGTVAAGLMQGGLYGASKIKSENKHLQSLQRLGKEGLGHGYGSTKKKVFTYATGALLDGALDATLW
jgi:hypothetical protein